MLEAFWENAELLQNSLGITPLLYGSLGLEYLTGENWKADDIDILIPGIFLEEKWPEFRGLLEKKGYVLTDAHEHTFHKNGIAFSYARLEELETFAGISPEEIRVYTHGSVSFRLLSAPQYRSVYCASILDGYRTGIRGKKDGEKIAYLDRLLQA